MKINSVIKLFPLLVAGLLVGCSSADKTEDTITLDLAEVVTYEVANEPAPAKQKTPKVVPTHKTELPGHLCFELNSTHLTADGTDLLAQVAAMLRTSPTASVTIVGHTCNVGEESYNQWLSLRRAESVRDTLQQEYGITNPISVEGKGSGEPKESNETRQGRQANRRVEVYIFK